MENFDALSLVIISLGAFLLPLIVVSCNKRCLAPVVAPRCVVSCRRSQARLGTSRMVDVALARTVPSGSSSMRP